MRCIHGSRVKIVSVRNPMVHGSWAPLTRWGWGSVRLRRNDGIRLRPPTAFGARSA